MTRTILVVDDDFDLAELLQTRLTGAGYLAQIATTGKEALHKAWTSPPDLVVLDLILPDQHGFNICQTLRNAPVTAAVPIIMMTAHPGEMSRLVGLEMGADCYLTKPFQMDEMLEQVDKLLKGDRRSSGAASVLATAPPASGNPHLMPQAVPVHRKEPQSRRAAGSND